MSILKLENVSYRYNDAEKDDYVLKNINYEFDKGKVYAIKGKSGSGKTTLLSLISGLEKINEGKIYFNDQDLSKCDLDKYRSRDIGIIFQSYNLLPHLTAIENVILSMDINHLDIKDKKKEAIKLLESVQISEKEGERRVLKLSGGEQQRVAIARSLSYNPEIILADEPTGNLDKDNEEGIIELLTKLAHEDKMCVIIISHSSRVKEAVDRVYYLENGKLKDEKD